MENHRNHELSMGHFQQLCSKLPEGYCCSIPLLQKHLFQLWPFFIATETLRVYQRVLPMVYHRTVLYDTYCIIITYHMIMVQLSYTIPLQCYIFMIVISYEQSSKPLLVDDQLGYYPSPSIYWGFLHDPMEESLQTNHVPQQMIYCGVNPNIILYGIPKTYTINHTLNSSRGIPTNQPVYQQV